MNCDEMIKIPPLLIKDSKFDSSDNKTFFLLVSASNIRPIICKFKLVKF